MDIRINTISDSLHDRIDGYTNKYNISNRCENLGSKQCRYEIETTGKLPDDQRSGKRKDVAWGTSEPFRVRVTKNSDELMALDYLKSVHCIAI